MARILRNRRGFTLVELMVVVAVIAILAAVAIPLYSNVQTRARITKARADLRTLASAVTTYQARLGALPATLDDLTITVTDAGGAAVGPFIAGVPAAPATWSYAALYSVNPDGTFTLSASGDGTVITLP